MRRWIVIACSLLGLGVAACSAEADDDGGVVGGAADAKGDAADDKSDAVSSGFKHPGLLLTKERIDSVKSALRSDQDNARKQGWRVLTRDARAKLDYEPTPYDVVHVVPAGSNDEERAFHDDAQAAYLHAVQWAVTGSEDHKRSAIKIMNAWARRLDRLESTGSARQVQLEAAWVAPMFANAAEIVRRYDGGGARWSSSEIRTFNKMLDLLYGYAEQTKDSKGNWGASASYAMMAIGVFQDDPARYNAGKAALVNSIASSIFEDGEVRELKARDCIHPQYTLEAHTQAAEVARSQGDESIYELKLDGQSSPRLTLGMQYMAKSLLRGEGVRDCRDARLQPGYGEIAVRYYRSKHRELPLFETAVKEARPSGTSGQFLGWTTATHGLDF